MARHRPRRRRLLSAVALVAAVGVAFGLYWFQPWKLFVDHRVDEKLPSVALASPAADETTLPPTTPLTQPATQQPATQQPATQQPATQQPATPTRAAAPRAVLLSRGSLISHEHSTSGTVSVVRQPDGSRVLALANLDTSDGPDVHVWLTDAPVIRGDKGWHVFDDGRHIDLGGLKGNLGNQLYRIPASADLATLTSVSIWCERFDVSFGAAELTPAG